MDTSNLISVFSVVFVGVILVLWVGCVAYNYFKRLGDGKVKVFRKSEKVDSDGYESEGDWVTETSVDETDLEMGESHQSCYE